MLVSRTVCKCGQCGYEWLSKGRKGLWDGVRLPAKCPNPECKNPRRWNRDKWTGPQRQRRPSSPSSPQTKPASKVPRVAFEPVVKNDCLLAPNDSMARTLRFRMLGHPPRTTVDATCGEKTCFAPKHVFTRPWKNLGGQGKWTPLAVAVRALGQGMSLDYAYENSTPAKTRLRGGVQSTVAGRYLRFTLRSTPTGVRITRLPDWSCGRLS